MTQLDPAHRVKMSTSWHQVLHAVQIVDQIYIWNSVLYTGKGTKFNNKYGEYGLSSSSVISLIDQLLGKGYCVTMDNFYMSPELFEIIMINIRRMRTGW